MHSTSPACELARTRDTEGGVAGHWTERSEGRGWSESGTWRSPVFCEAKNDPYNKLQYNYDSPHKLQFL